MRKDLRLLMWQACDRTCPGCCNKDWDMTALNVANDFSQYETIMLTGGEPLLFPEKLEAAYEEIRNNNYDANIIVYTAMVKNTELFVEMALKFDGITLTIHEQEDVEGFIRICEEIDRYSFLWGDIEHLKSMRLNVFAGIEFPPDFVMPEYWKVKSGIEWIKDCPLPENEDFKRYWPT